VRKATAGACTVVLGELAADGRTVDYRAINSCIRFLPTIDGKELVTVESLQGADGELHPVQQAMVQCHASQCGFLHSRVRDVPVSPCISTWTEDRRGYPQPPPEREDVITALSGNLCRCTGYRPIIDAGRRMSEYPAPKHWSRDEAQSPDRVSRLRALQRTALQSALCFPGFSCAAHRGRVGLSTAGSSRLPSSRGRN